MVCYVMSYPWYLVLWPCPRWRVDLGAQHEVPRTAAQPANTTNNDNTNDDNNSNDTNMFDANDNNKP